MASLAEHLTAELIHLLEESFAKVKHCVNQLSEDQLWWRPAAGLNSVANLMLHLAGNLRQWAVAGVGESQDDRDRESEFARDHDAGMQELLGHLASAVADAKSVIESLSEDAWTSEIAVQGFTPTKLGALLHTIPHFTGHAHQIILLTRQQLGDAYQFAWEPSGQRDRVPI